MSKLLSPLAIRGVNLKNRVVVSPMCQYSAVDGVADDWHFAHLARFALGGFGLVIAEATAVAPAGRISYADLGLWSDHQVLPLQRIVDFLHSQGAAAGIQLAHAGRKASTAVPWRGGVAERDDEKAAVGYADWQPVAPSVLRHTATRSAYKVPHALTVAEIAEVREAFAAAAVRADIAGFDVIEIHAAHGYLVNQFLSPIANLREDHYGGSLENRMRLLLEVVTDVRTVWPAAKPLFVRLSVTDGCERGWSVADSIELARMLRSLGVDVIDCSSAGFETSVVRPGPMYQLPLARALRQALGISTMTVGLIDDPAEAEAALQSGDADLIALARPALDDPNWPLHARFALGEADESYADWPKQAGYAVKAMDRALKRRAFAGT
eukprot:gene26735-29356_t